MRFEIMKLLAEEHDWIVDNVGCTERTDELMDAMALINDGGVISKHNLKKILKALEGQIRYDTNQNLAPDDTMKRMGKVIEIYEKLKERIDTTIELVGQEINREAAYKYGLPSTTRTESNENMVLEKLSIDYEPDDLPRVTATYTITMVQTNEQTE